MYSNDYTDDISNATSLAIVDVLLEDCNNYYREQPRNAEYQNFCPLFDSYFVNTTKPNIKRLIMRRQSSYG